MGKLILPGFREIDLSARVIDDHEDVRDSIAIPGCDAQLFAFGHPLGKTTVDHTHEQTSITFVRAGRASFTMAGSTAEVEAGDLILIPPLTVHRFEAVGDEPFVVAEMVIPPSCR